MSVRIPSVLLRTTLRPAGRLVFHPRASWPYQRRALELGLAWPGVPRGLTCHSTGLGGVPCEVLAPNQPQPRVLLYLHGGGYAVGSPRSHRALAGRLALELNATTYVPDYRLAPEARFPAAFDDSFAAYRALLAAGWRPDQIFVAGDSAGGGLSLALGIAAVERGVAVPAAIGLLCPAVDLTPEAMAALPRHRREPVLTTALIGRFGTTYLDPAQRTDHRVSPLLADFAGLPPLVVDAAGYDSLRDQARRTAAKARLAGVTVRYREHARLPHGFHSGAGLLKQADNALSGVAAALLELSAVRNQSS